MCGYSLKYRAAICAFQTGQSDGELANPLNGQLGGMLPMDWPIW
jgi:hypothetical protein